MTTRSFSNRIAGWFPAAGVLAFTSMIAGLLLTPATSYATTHLGASTKSAAPAPNSNQYGDLSAVWWQWILSFPVASNPNFMNAPSIVSLGNRPIQDRRTSGFWPERSAVRPTGPAQLLFLAAFRCSSLF